MVVNRLIIKEKNVELHDDYINDQIDSSLFLKTKRFNRIINHRGTEYFTFNVSKELGTGYNNIRMYLVTNPPNPLFTLVPIDEFAIFPYKECSDSLLNRVKYIYNEYLQYFSNEEMQISFLETTFRNSDLSVGRSADYWWKEVLPNVIESDGVKEKLTSFYILETFRNVLNNACIAGDSEEEVNENLNALDRLKVNLNNLSSMVEERIILE